MGSSVAWHSSVPSFESGCREEAVLAGPRLVNAAWRTNPADRTEAASIFSSGTDYIQSMRQSGDWIQHASFLLFHRCHRGRCPGARALARRCAGGWRKLVRQSRWPHVFCAAHHQHLAVHRGADGAQHDRAPGSRTTPGYGAPTAPAFGGRSGFGSGLLGGLLGVGLGSMLFGGGLFGGSGGMGGDGFPRLAPAGGAAVLRACAGWCVSS